MIGFYIVDEGQEWYWTGKGFSDNVEDQMTYTIKKPMDMIMNNLDKLPPVKAILKLDKRLKLKDIKVN